MPTRPMRAVPPVDDEGPLDMVAVQADDALINALAAGRRVSSAFGGHGPDDHIAAVLAAWKADIDAEPIPELIDVDAAVATILAASRPPAWRMRQLAPVAAAAAVAVLALGGITVGSASAQPNTLFWPVSKVLFSERAASVEAADRAENHITRAKVALTKGDPAAASAELTQAQADVGEVRPQEGQAQLADVQSFLAAKADETPPGMSADLSAPLRRNPGRPVPAGSALTQDPDPAVGQPQPTAADLPTSASATPDPSGQGPSRPRHFPPGFGGTPTPTPTSTPTATAEGRPDPTSTTTGMGATGSVSGAPTPPS